MPEFFSMAAADAAYEGKLDDFTSAYIMALYWTETGEEDQPAAEVDLHLEARVSCEEECREFQQLAHLHLQRAYALPGGYTEAQAGHDFWLSRNGHGAGFFCRDQLADGLGDALQELAHARGTVDVYHDTADNRIRIY